MGLDEFGFPEVAVANSVLLGIDSYGESGDDLEENWAKWIHHIPFDSSVSRALIRLYTRRLENLDKEENAAEYQLLERKLDLVRRRAERYDIRRLTRSNL